MAVRERRLPRTQQPQDAPQLAAAWQDGLCFVQNGSQGAVDLATNTSRTSGVGAPGLATGGLGIGRSYSSTSDYYSGNAALNAATSYTVLLVCNISSFANYAGLLAHTSNLGTNGGFSAFQYSVADGFVGNFGGTGLFVSAGYGTSGITSMGDVVLVCTYRANGDYVFYRNGIVTASGTNTGLAPTTGAGYVKVGAARDTDGISGRFYLAAAWDRALSSGDVLALSINPWQLFEPQRIWVPVSAGGGGATPQTLSSSLSLAVQVARSATASLGLAVQAPASATASVTLAVQQALTAQASLGTAVQLARTAAASLDTAVQTARSASTGTSLAVQAPASAVLSADIAVQQARSASASVDAYVQAATQLVASLDLLVQEGHALSVALEVAVQAARTGTSSVDLAVQAARAASAGVDAAVQQARSAAASVGLAVQAARAAGASVDLYVQAGFALVAGLDVAVRFAASAAASVDLAVATARSASVQIGAAVAVQQVLGAAMQAAVRASAVATCGVGLYVDDPAALVHSAAPLVPRVQGAARRAAVQSVIRAAAGQRTRR